MPIQTLTPHVNAGSILGQALGQGFQQGMSPALQQQYQKQQLEQAFNNLDPNASYIDQLKAIAPTLVSTPGGGQVLSELASVLAAQARNKPIRNILGEKEKPQPGQPKQPGGINNQPPEQSASQPPIAPGKQGEVIPQGEEYFRRPQAPEAIEKTYPEATVVKPTPELSEPEMEAMAANIMDQAAQSGVPISFKDAIQVPIALNQERRAQNQVLEGEKQQREQAATLQSAGMVKRAQDANLLDFPGADIIAKNAAYESRNSRNENEQFQYVQSKLNEAKGHYNNIVRQPTSPGPFEKFYRSLLGTHKEKKDIMRDIQPDIKYYKDLGLFDDLRKMLTSDVGMGIEDAETTIFFPSDKEWKGMNSLKSNPVKTKPKDHEASFFSEDYAIGDIFPDERYKTNETGFKDLKQGLRDYLRENPQANLITLRGILNRDKRYYWGDISRAISEIQEENKMVKNAWHPDLVQQRQMSIIQQAPLPGLAQQFKFLWEGAK